MMRKALATLVLLAAAARADTTLTFPAALERALQARALPAAFDEHVRTLETLPVRTLPTVRAETGFSSSSELNVITERLGRFDAFTAFIAVDYPLLGHDADRRRVEELRNEAQLLRVRSSDEADEVFRHTLDAFAALYTSDQRIALLHEGARRATELRDRLPAMLQSGQISNLTAAQWQDEALATESMLVDLQLQRLDAETRLKHLLGDTSSEPLHVSLTLDDAAPAPSQLANDPAVARASLVEQRRELDLQEATAQRRPQLMLSAFGGVAAVPSTFHADSDEGTFGIYGIRATLSLPWFNAAAARRLAVARLELDQATRDREQAAAAMRNRADLTQIAIAAAQRRIELLEQAVDVARQRQESVVRLVDGGVRPESDLLDATSALARRESDLLAARVEKWKLIQQAVWNGRQAPSPVELSRPQAEKTQPGAPRQAGAPVFH